MSALVEPEGDPNQGRRSHRDQDSLEEIQIAILVATMPCTQPVGAYQIVRGLEKRVDGGCMYAESRVYREIKNLAKCGYLDATEVETSRGTRTHYLPTQRGVEAIRDWVRTPIEIPMDARNELWLRIAAIWFSRPQDVLRGLGDLEDDLDDRLDRLNLIARQARRTGIWNLSRQLEYQLEIVVIDACRRWLTDATSLLEAKVEQLARDREAT
jgi:DNA-binding PadR family transcriptional regulator